MFSKNGEDVVDVLQPEQLFKKLYRRLYDFAYYLLKDKELAEDVAQDAFVVYLEQQDSIAANFNAVKSFLYTTVKNCGDDFGNFL